MPSISPNTPTVSVQVPVPTPVQQKPKPQPQAAPQPKKPRQPVAFGGEVHPPPGVMAPSKYPTGIILPWSPAPSSPQQMKRLPRKTVVVKYARPINIAQPGETAHEALTRLLGNRQQRRLGRTSTIFRDDEGNIHVRLHNTNVVTAHSNGQVTLNHGGYMGPTTRRFMGYANPVIRNVSFAGGKFMILGPNGWEEYKNGTKYPPPQPDANEPVPERGKLTPEQAELLHQYHLTGENTPLGMLGDSLIESGYPHTGGLLSRRANEDPGTGGMFVGEYHPSYQQSPELQEHDFHFVPGMGKHDLHSLHIEIPRSNSSGTRGQFLITGSKPAPEKLSRLPRKRIKFGIHGEDLPALFKAARQNPYESVIHGMIADKLEEMYPDSPLPGLIREQYGLGEHSGKGVKDTMWWEPFYSSWDGTFPYAARLGKHGPFSLYMTHEGTPEVQGTNQRWILHVVSDMKGSRDSGYNFEFPHEEAHRIPRLFNTAASYIHPQTHGLIERGGKWVQGPPHDEGYRNHEAESFDERMDEEERNRQ